jgi:hypothetical protein
VNSIYPSVYLSLCLICLSISLTIYLSIRLSIRLSICLSIDLCIYLSIPVAPSCSIGISETLHFTSISYLRQSVGLLGWAVNPSQGRYLHRTTQTQNKIRQTCMPWLGFETKIPVFERAKTFHALDGAFHISQILHPVWFKITILIPERQKLWCSHYALLLPRTFKYSLHHSVLRHPPSTLLP